MVEKIGEFKKEQELTSFQVERWNEITKSRINWAKDKNLDNLNAIEQLADDITQVLSIAGLKYYSELKNKFNKGD